MMNTNQDLFDRYMVADRVRRDHMWIKYIHLRGDFQSLEAGMRESLYTKRPVSSSVAKKYTGEGTSIRPAQTFDALFRTIRGWFHHRRETVGPGGKCIQEG